MEEGAGVGAPPGKALHQEDPPPQAKFTQKKSRTPTSKTFVMGHEDHTLGNSLRHVIAQEYVSYRLNLLTRVDVLHLLQQRAHRICRLQHPTPIGA